MHGRAERFCCATARLDEGVRDVRDAVPIELRTAKRLSCLSRHDVYAGIRTTGKVWRSATAATIFGRSLPTFFAYAVILAPTGLTRSRAALRNARSRFECFACTADCQHSRAISGQAADALDLSLSSPRARPNAG